MKGVEFLKRFKADSVKHSSASLLVHLEGTGRILREWNCPAYLVKAGLFHSIYGTESFEQGLVSWRDRQIVEKVIGKRGEKLAYLFAAKTRRSFNRTVQAICKNRKNNGQNDFVKLTIEDRFTRSSIDCSREEISDLCAMVLANAAEQASRHPELLNDDFQFFVEVASLRLPQIASFFAAEKNASGSSEEASIFRIVRFLSWKLPVGTISDIRRDFQQYAVEQVECRIMELACNGEDLPALARRLPPAEFERFALAPATYNHLVSRVKPYSGDAAEFARRSMIAELARLGVKIEHQGVWTALGDEYFPAANAKRESENKSGLNDTNADERYTA
ncbi:MAG: hypothetical protein M3Q33_06830, partial [Acidobacteriota bacterium]|nr:hypothetical protein [Acidobacteriota bacterium]